MKDGVTPTIVYENGQRGTNNNKNNKQQQQEQQNGRINSK